VLPLEARWLLFSLSSAILLLSELAENAVRTLLTGRWFSCEGQDVKPEPKQSLGRQSMGAIP